MVLLHELQNPCQDFEYFFHCFFQEPTSGNTIVHEIIDVSERKQLKYIKSSEEVKLWNDALCQVCSTRRISLLI